MIELSVHVPMFRVKYIAWLALESLKNQQDISFEWELIIVEEQNDETFGIDNVMMYEKSLKNIGCMRIKYIALQDWIPLSEKYKIHISHNSSTSEIVIPTAADSYLPPLRLYRVYGGFKNKQIEWFRGTKAILYEIATDITILIDVGDRPTGIYKALNQSLALRALKSKGESFKGVDLWYLRACQPERVFVDKSEDWKYGFGTHGFHSISLKRKVKPSKKSTGTWSKCPVNIRKNVPSYIIKKLDDSKQYLKNHKFELLKYMRK